MTQPSSPPRTDATSGDTRTRARQRAPRRPKHAAPAASAATVPSTAAAPPAAAAPARAPGSNAPRVAREAASADANRPRSHVRACLLSRAYLALLLVRVLLCLATGALYDNELSASGGELVAMELGLAREGWVPHAYRAGAPGGGGGGGDEEAAARTEAVLRAVGNVGREGGADGERGASVSLPPVSRRGARSFAASLLLVHGPPLAMTRFAMRVATSLASVSSSSATTTTRVAAGAVAAAMSSMAPRLMYYVPRVAYMLPLSVAADALVVYAFPRTASPSSPVAGAAPGDSLAALLTLASWWPWSTVMVRPSTHAVEVLLVLAMMATALRIGPVGRAAEQEPAVSASAAHAGAHGDAKAPAIGATAGHHDGGSSKAEYGRQPGAEWCAQRSVTPLPLRSSATAFGALAALALFVKPTTSLAYVALLGVMMAHYMYAAPASRVIAVARPRCARTMAAAGASTSRSAGESPRGRPGRLASSSSASPSSSSSRSVSSASLAQARIRKCVAVAQGMVAFALLGMLLTLIDSLYYGTLRVSHPAMSSAASTANYVNAGGGGCSGGSAGLQAVRDALVEVPRALWRDYHRHRVRRLRSGAYGDIEGALTYAGYAPLASAHAFIASLRGIRARGSLLCVPLEAAVRPLAATLSSWARTVCGLRRASPSPHSCDYYYSWTYLLRHLPLLCGPLALVGLHYVCTVCARDVARDVRREMARVLGRERAERRGRGAVGGRMSRGRRRRGGGAGRDVFEYGDSPPAGQLQRQPPQPQLVVVAGADVTRMRVESTTSGRHRARARRDSTAMNELQDVLLMLVLAGAAVMSITAAADVHAGGRDVSQQQPPQQQLLPEKDGAFAGVMSALPILVLFGGALFGSSSDSSPPSCSWWRSSLSSSSPRTRFPRSRRWMHARCLRYAWLVYNAALVVYYGVLREAGVAPAMFHAASSSASASPEMVFNAPADIVFMHTDAPPRALLALHDAERVRVHNLRGATAAFLRYFLELELATASAFSRDEAQGADDEEVVMETRDHERGRALWRARVDASATEAGAEFAARRTRYVVAPGAMQLWKRVHGLRRVHRIYPHWSARASAVRVGVHDDGDDDDKENDDAGSADPVRGGGWWWQRWRPSWSAATATEAVSLDVYEYIG